MIPVCEPTLGPLESANVQKAMASGWISSAGEFLDRFENEFPKKVGAQYGVAVCNGTVALHLALKAAGIKEGDEVILPGFTIISTAIAVKYCGATPVFVDVDPDHWTIDVNQIEAAISPRTKAILSVTMYGHPSNYKVIDSIKQKHSLIWIEDAAEGHASTVNGMGLAHQPDLTTYSFYANKIVTTGEGGMVCTNSSELFDRCRYLKNLAFSLRGPRNYIHQEIGFNYRMTNLQAAIGCAQMDRMPELAEARRNNARIYQQAFSVISDFVSVQKEAIWAKSMYWMFGLTINKNCCLQRDELMAKLKLAGVDTRPFFFPMNRQPALQLDFDLPVSDFLGARGFYVPSSSHLSSTDIQMVCETTISLVRGASSFA